MQYFLLPSVLLILFELLGNIISNKYNIKKFNLNVVIGFCVTLGLFQLIALPLAMIRANFLLLLVLTIVYFCALFVYILRNRRYFRANYSLNKLIVFFGLFVLQIILTNMYTIGSLYKYDIVSYTNQITNTIYYGIGNVGLANGYDLGSVKYDSQGYYQLASVLYYICNGVYSKLHIDYFYFTQHSWMYSIILYVIHSELIIDLIDYFKVNKKRTYLLTFVFVVLYMFNYYWNKEQAYLGNSFRMALCSYMFMFIDTYFKENDSKYLWLFLTLNFGNNACAWGNASLTLIYVFGIWLFIENAKDFRILILILMQAIPHLSYTMSESCILTVLISIIFLVGYFIYNQLYMVMDKLKPIAPWLAAIVLIGLSLCVTRNLFDFSATFHNRSGNDDMAWNYFEYLPLWRACANIMFYIVLATLFIKRKNSKTLLIVTLIALIFFNPMAVGIQNKYMSCWHRNYDIFMNFATIVYCFKVFEDCEKYKKVIFGLIGLAIPAAIGQLNYHQEGSFDIFPGYNRILRMSDDEAETIRFVKDLFYEKGLGTTKAISSIYQLRTELPQLKTLYGRSKAFNEIEEERDLYEVFYPEDYYGDPYAPKNPKYNKMCELIVDNEYKLIVQDKNKLIYDKSTDTYYSFTYKINDCGKYPSYENDNYAVYYFGE